MLSVEIGFVDMTLLNAWKALEHDDPVLFARFLEFAGQRGYAESLETARKTDNLSALLHSLSNTSEGQLNTVSSARQRAAATSCLASRLNKHRQT